MNKKTRILCEAAIMIALAQILSYIRLYEFPNGGSIDVAMLPILVFGLRAGVGWGFGAGLIYGLLQYFLGNGIAIDWTSMVVDYLVAYALLGLGAGVGYHFRRGGAVVSTVVGCVLRFLAHLIVGVYVWGKYMPDVFLGLPMQDEWFYSLLYNGTFMGIDFVLCMILMLLLMRFAPKYVYAGCLDQPKKAKTAE